MIGSDVKALIQGYSRRKQINSSPFQTYLPSNPRKQPIRPRPNTILPPLIQHQQSQPERRRQEPILDRHLARANRLLQTGDVAENKHHDNCKHHAGEQEPVLRLFVENRGLLEDTQAAGTCGEQVEELPGEEVSLRRCNVENSG